MHSVGVDIIEISRVREALARRGERFVHRIYTDREAAFCRGRIPELAARFAAKEAVSKALGTGMHGIAWKEIEVLPDLRGKPEVCLHGGASRRAQEMGLTCFAISLSHSRDYAVAFVSAT